MVPIFVKQGKTVARVVLNGSGEVVRVETYLSSHKWDQGRWALREGGLDSLDQAAKVRELIGSFTEPEFPAPNVMYVRGWDKYFRVYDTYVSSHPWKDRQPSQRIPEPLRRDDAKKEIAEHQEKLREQEEARKAEEARRAAEDPTIDPDRESEGVAIPDPNSNDIFIFRPTKDGRYRLAMIWPVQGRMMAVDLGVAGEVTLEYAEDQRMGWTEEGNPEDSFELDNDDLQRLSALQVKG